MRKKRRLLDEYQFPGFHPKAGIQGVFGDPKARVIHLKRTQKKQYVGVAAQFIGVTTTRRRVAYGTYPAGMRESIWKWIFGESNARGARR